jgi:hypothetical protein
MSFDERPSSGSAGHRDRLDTVKFVPERLLPQTRAGMRRGDPK